MNDRHPLAVLLNIAKQNFNQLPLFTFTAYDAKVKYGGNEDRYSTEIYGSELESALPGPFESLLISGEAIHAPFLSAKAAVYFRPLAELTPGFKIPAR